MAADKTYGIFQNLCMIEGEDFVPPFFYPLGTLGV